MFLCWNNSDLLRIASTLRQGIYGKSILGILNTTEIALQYDTKFIGKYIIELLINIKSDEYIDNVEVLIEPFRCGVTNNDMRLIKLIISKIDIKNKDKILKFCLTKNPLTKKHCLCHATNSKLLEPLQSLFKLITDNIPDYDIVNNILLNPQHNTGHLGETTLITAINCSRPHIVRYLLSIIKNEKDQIKFIEMESVYDILLTVEHFKNGGCKMLINAVLNCLRQSRFTSLKEILKCYDEKSISSITKYKTNKNQTIYHFINGVRSAEYLEKECKIPFGLEQFNLPDIDGNTMFLRSVSSSYYHGRIIIMIASL